MLRNPNQHVLVQDGRVRAGRFTTNHLIHHSQQLGDTVGDTFRLAYYRVPHPAETIGSHGYYDPTADEPERNFSPDMMGKALSDHWRRNIERLRDSRPHDYYDEELFDRLHKNLEDAPYEEVDHTHPSEQG
jgi:hypothetical protein